MTYRRRATPLHATRAACACAYCLALALAALLSSNPIWLAAAIAAIAGAGIGAKMTRELRRAARLAIPMAIVIAAVNALVTRDGLTVIVRLGDLPILGHTDITLEATGYGGVLGLRAIALILAATLYTTTVDPDGVLNLFRRISFHSALSATLATRMVPILARDAGRLADARRCRPGRPPGRLTLMRAATAGMLDHALDVAAALEVRGYGAAHRPPPRRAPLSRHDLAFGAAAIAILALAITVRVAGLAPFTAYPALDSPAGPQTLLASAALTVAALLPFADRRAIEP